MNPILSILIPTKDRYNCLISVIRGLEVHFENQSLEIVVQDNTANNKEFLDFLETEKPKFVKYYHEPLQISMSENCDRSVKNSTGDYLILIGDDDYVFTTIYKCIEWMGKNNIEVLNNAFSVYNWQGVETKTRIRHIPEYTYIMYKNLNNTYKIFQTKKELKYVISTGGGLGPQNLPRLYHGIVKKEVMDRIQNTCGTFFPGPSPDMAVATALACQLDVHAHFDGVFSVAGVSKSSNTGLSTVGKNVGDLDEIPFLDKHYIKQWDERIPKVWAVSTIWPQSMVQSLNENRYSSDINLPQYYGFLLAISSAFSPKVVKKITLQKIKEKQSLFFILKTSYYFCTAWVLRIFNLLTKRHLLFKNVKNISETYEITLKSQK